MDQLTSPAAIDASGRLIVPGRAHGSPAPKDGFAPFGADGLTFFDVLDIINPLQHIPVVSTLYRELTDDVLDPVPRIAGGALFGGLAGAVSALVNVVVEAVSGDDIGGHVMAVLEDIGGWSDPGPPPASSVASLAGAATTPLPDPGPFAAPGFVAAAPGPDPFAVIDTARRDRAYASVLTAARTAADELTVPKRAGETDTAIRGLTRLSVEA